MALKTTLSLKQSQKITLTPDLRRSLTLLRMPTLDLIEHIRTEAIDNPLLQITDPSESASSSASAYDFALSSVAATVTLGDSIRQQLATQSLPPSVRDAAVYLTGDLSENGFLETTIEEATIALDVTKACIEAAIEAIQSCEPTGVGARDLTECLFLQMVEKDVDPVIAKGALGHVQLLVEGKWPALSALLNVPEAELEQLAAILRSLSPEPVQNPDTVSRPLVPDIIVEDIENRGLTVSLSKQYLPDLSLDTALLREMKSAQPTAEYAVSHRTRAQTLIRAVKYRGETLLRIAQAIVTHQYRYFVDGPTHLAPLNRTTIATRLSLHPSTVGRAIADKNLEFCGTLYPLDYFLSSGLKKGDDGQVSAYVVQRTICELIEQEIANAPLSDDAIVKKLHSNGVDIARRTVAKYRGCMNIPSSFVRRRITAARHTPQKSPGHKKNLGKHPK